MAQFRSNYSSPGSLYLPTSSVPIRNSIMYRDVPTHSLSVRRRIFMMSAVLTLSNLALSITRNSRIYLFEQARCLLYYQFHDPTQINSQYAVDERLCKLDDIQYPLSIVIGIDSWLSLLPGKVFHFSWPLAFLAHYFLVPEACESMPLLSFSY